MPRFLLVSVFILAANSLNASIYKWIDSQGVTHLSDSRQEDFTNQALGISEAKSNSVQHKQNLSITPSPSKKEQGYEVEIFQPKNQETIRNNQGRLIVLSRLSRPLFRNKQQLLLDDKIYCTQTGSYFVLDNVNRGAHKLVIQIVDGQGKIISVSQPIVIYMHRAFIRRNS
ncbi:hypothetical protein Ljor_0408 [Legionella jordanis]|uniref:DUF4124 domain-containing protein n=1 Tax=Legionella jordanis TaxID=456 RepID=A0A0W0V8A6_9GAMM|nr:hypothetical protein Ljor_0408 [Legionella jordanis]VEH12438.1 Uncharacterised protein [Legionella jordanis]